jgi:methylated-DNA-protein-cysteine methyltransferase-like protein
MQKELTKFSQRVLKLIKTIPKGKVATYGQIAKLAGKPGAARAVAWLLHSCSKSHRLPWHRVLNSKGGISFSVYSLNYILQKNLLEKERIVFVDGRLNLKKYLFKKTRP